jgi:hypothetical protein
VDNHQSNPRRYKVRVQIPPYTDRWMMGDRYGEVLKVTKRSERYVGVPSNRPKQAVYEIAHVLLDKSGKVRKFVLDDCIVID